MGESKHTPGPWLKTRATNKPIHECDFLIHTANEKHIAEVFEQQWPLSKARSIIDPTANAQLIAAAPDLLEACEEFMFTLSYPGEAKLLAGVLAAKKISIAIKKAKGE
jgi:hypothetical protein